MKADFLLAGVGGQGTLLASKIIAQTAIRCRSFVRTTETIGMAQRGGCVVSHIRIGAENCSSSIPVGVADLIIGFEPAEAARNLRFLKPEGRLLINTSPIIPVTASLDSATYPVGEIIEYLRNTGNQAVFIDGNRLCAAAGSAKVLNIIMLGVAIKEGLLPFSREDVLSTITENLPASFLELNCRALEVGCNSGQYAS